MDDLVSRNKVFEAVRSGTTHDDIRARIEIMESVPAIPISVIEEIKDSIIDYLEYEGFNSGYIEHINKVFDCRLKEYTE